jgi:hypothetical protein
MFQFYSRTAIKLPIWDYDANSYLASLQDIFPDVQQ